MRLETRSTGRVRRRLHLARSNGRGVWLSAAQASPENTRLAKAARRGAPRSDWRPFTSVPPFTLPIKTFVHVGDRRGPRHSRLPTRVPLERRAKLVWRRVHDERSRAT